MSVVLKGFIVPSGYTLTITGSDGVDIVKYPGEYSGSHYTFDEVDGGSVPNWTLSRVVVSPPQNTELQSILAGIHLSGGEALFVGGVVRDLVSGRESKDTDIEVYGVQPEELVNLLSNFGKVSTVGASFGIIKLSTPEEEYDFSLPRRETKEGVGHRGFMVESDPFMTPEEAASRRDFSINSLAMTHDGTLLDFFGGMKDLKAGILRHTSEKFSEDPLRVLRGFQFAGRFNMSMDKRTAEMCRSLRSEYETISKERIWGEWEKWALKSKVPSAAIQVLEDTGWIELYPELFSLKGVLQDPTWHPEGDVLVHTKHVVDMAAYIADREGLDNRDRMILMFSALCHDFGKPETTEFLNGRWRAPAHDKAGVRPALTFLQSIGAPLWLAEQVAPLVAEHMAHIVPEMNERIVRRMASRVEPSNLRLLSYVIEADHSGRPPLPAELPESAKEMVRLSKILDVEGGKPEPLIGGEDLFELADAGLIPSMFQRPGPHFGVLLSKLYNDQLDGVFSSVEDGKRYLADMMNREVRDIITENIKFLSSMKRGRIHFVIQYANDAGMTEDQLLRLPLSELKEMALLSQD